MARPNKNESTTIELKPLNSKSSNHRKRPRHKKNHKPPNLKNRWKRFKSSSCFLIPFIGAKMVTLLITVFVIPTLDLGTDYNAAWIHWK